MEFLYMCIVEKNHAKNIEEFPTLKPEAAWFQSCMIEAMCTGIFVMANLLVKDPRSGFAGHGHGWMGCFTIAAALSAMIFVAGPHSGASLNPAVSVALHCLKSQIMKAGTHHYMFSVYLVGPLIGAVGAGLFSWAHRCMLTFVDAEASFGEDAEGLAAHREAANKENHEASAENNA
jgi:glycerol uptake facilitator-like aquaporin